MEQRREGGDHSSRFPHFGEQAEGAEPGKGKATFGEEGGNVVLAADMVAQDPLIAERASPQCSPMNHEPRDLIGDIHGVASALRDLLRHGMEGRYFKVPR